MYENNDVFIGWAYIKALFDCLHEMSKKVKSNQMVTPRYIFRGITQRHFTSSSDISKYLDENPQETSSLLCKEPDNGKFTQKQKRKAEVRFYEEKHSEMLRYIGERACHDQSNALELLRTIVGLTQGKDDTANANELFEWIKPRYIRSGAAVRLYDQCNSTQYDYVAYLKYLIAEAKSRYPVEYGNLSDLELLAELQHKGAATCLVDFSTNFLISLWFATQDYVNSNQQIGYVFCYDTNTDAIERNNLVFLNSDRESCDIEQLIDRTSRTLDFHGSTLCRFLLWKPSNINTRIARQDSIFVFGIEKFDISEHPIFILPIPPHWKKPIQRVLKDFFGITGETLYADAAGVAASNGKMDPLRTQTKYFNEDILKRKDGLGFDCMDIFQKGTSSLLKAQYKIALEYFCSFEGSNFHSIKQLDCINFGVNERYPMMIMLLSELYYSKGICLRHLGKYHDAKNNYDKSISTCIKLLEYYKDDNLPCIKGNYLEYVTNLHRYVFDKLFKILEDYVDFLFDINDYHIIYSLLNNVLNYYKTSYNTPPSEMCLLMSTVCNEAKVLSDIWTKGQGSDLKFIDISESESYSLNPLCGILNKLYRLISQIVKDNQNDKKNRYPDLEEDIIKDIADAIQKQSIPRNGYEDRNDIFVGWLLDDIKNVVTQRLENNPFAQNEILRLTAIVEDCRRQIEGRKRNEAY